MSIKTRQLSAVEANIVHELAWDIWPHAFKDILEEDQIKYMLEWMYDVNTLQEQMLTGTMYFTVEEFGRPKGFIGVEPNYPNSGYLRIHKFYVLPEEQGKGLGRVLFNQVVDTAFDVECQKLHLNVNRFNKAVDFYKYLGFNITGEENIDIGKDYLMEDYIMELELRS